jgi:hypothetical protein
MPWYVAAYRYDVQCPQKQVRELFNLTPEPSSVEGRDETRSLCSLAPAEDQAESDEDARFLQSLWTKDGTTRAHSPVVCSASFSICASESNDNCTAEMTSLGFEDALRLRGFLRRRLFEKWRAWQTASGRAATCTPLAASAWALRRRARKIGRRRLASDSASRRSPDAPASAGAAEPPGPPWGPRHSQARRDWGPARKRLRVWRRRASASGRVPKEATKRASDSPD